MIEENRKLVEATDISRAIGDISILATDATLLKTLSVTLEPIELLPHIVRMAYGYAVVYANIERLLPEHLRKTGVI